MIVNDHLECIYLGDGRVRVDAKKVHERGCFDTWYAVPARYVTLRPEWKVTKCLN